MRGEVELRIRLGLIERERRNLEERISRLRRQITSGIGDRRGALRAVVTCVQQRRYLQSYSDGLRWALAIETCAPSAKIQAG